MMKRKTYITYMLGLLWMAAMAMTACSTDIAEPSREEGEGRMAVCLSVLTADYATADTRATGAVKGVEGIAQNGMQLLCFDKAGFYVGMGQNVEIDPNVNGDENLHTLKATVPNSTARIHFVANGNITSDPEWIGMSENNLMARLTSKFDTHEQMVYWGYRRMANAEEMKAFLANSSNVVYMLRDRAKLTVESADANITSVTMALCNGIDRGTMAPMDKSNLTSPFPQIESRESWNSAALSYLTLPNDTAHIYDNGNDMSNVAYAYENENRSDNPLMVILKCVYKSGKTKYQKILLQDSKFQNYVIKRNHTYKITVQQLGEQYGSDNFADAVQGQAANDVWVSVSDIISEISSGQYTMKIRDGQAGETSVVYTYGATGVQTIPFTYSGDNNMTAADFVCKWTSNNGLTLDDQPTLTFNGSGKQSTISFNLAGVTDNQKTATLRLLDTKHGLSRNIKLYSISYFPFTFTTSNGESTGTPVGVSIGSASGKETTITFSIPDYYPEDLLPIKVMFASNDVNPRNLDVEVGSTAEVSGSEDWNCWFVKNCEQAGKYTVTLRNVREKNAGETGVLYMKADYFGKDAASVGKAIAIPITFN